MMYIVSLSSDLPSAHRGCPRGGKGAHTCTRRRYSPRIGICHRREVGRRGGDWVAGRDSNGERIERSDEECFVPADPKWLPQCRREW